LWARAAPAATSASRRTSKTTLGPRQEITPAPVALSIPGLWDLKYGVGSAPATSLYFSAGPAGETHGLLGTITVIP